MKNKSLAKKKSSSNHTPRDYKDPTGRKTPSGHPKKNSGYDEQQPSKLPR